ncbi:MAG: type II toxin-antitoxin system prevent-host-death family antitoxin [Acidimicrobiia bacterium]|nr:type II toxin-antitoxin system prevent-host-death family antitoxin [Acidimicrobiia bacterium]
MERNVVGARELKTRLGTYLRRVKRGRTVVITDRGLPIAEIRPLALEAGSEAVLAALRAAGMVSGGQHRRLTRFTPVRSRGRSAASVITKNRSDRL